MIVFEESESATTKPTTPFAIQEEPNTVQLHPRALPVGNECDVIRRFAPSDWPIAFAPTSLN